MYYVLAFAAVIAILGIAAALLLNRRPAFAETVQMPMPYVGGPIARLMRGELKEDRPCLTVIECVQERRCAGHCGCR
ncbi:MAG: hypothetical protein HY854_24970 [Burkholderiales bacterium]|nr:hypothetical protein [Burkholderiales bacterium]